MAIQKSPKIKLTSRKVDNMEPGIAMPTGYIDQTEVNAAPPGVAPTTIAPKPPTITPGLGKKLGATGPGSKPQGAIIPGNEQKQTSMMDATASKIGAASTGGAKTPEQSAAENKNYKNLLKKFNLY